MGKGKSFNIGIPAEVARASQPAQILFEILTR
jgi:hypothetical protein